MPGDGKKTNSDYESQLSKFPALKEAVNEAVDIIKQEQRQLVDLARQLGIRTDNILLSQDLNGEFTASVTEVILEGLRHIQPALLDKKENSYGLTY
jgi:ABC-type branched-subunit amino acid transport system ATPase component